MKLLITTQSTAWLTTITKTKLAKHLEIHLNFSATKWHCQAKSNPNNSWSSWVLWCYLVWWGKLKNLMKMKKRKSITLDTVGMLFLDKLIKWLQLKVTYFLPTHQWFLTQNLKFYFIKRWPALSSVKGLKAKRNAKQLFIAKR